jgi:esterase
VVLLHGLFGYGLGHFGDLMARLGPRFRFIALDQRGHGLSDHAAEYTWDRLVEDVALLTDHLRLERYDVVGHSMGGRVALIFASRFPARVRRLVISDMGPEQPPRAGLPRPEIRSSFADVDEAVRAMQERARGPDPDPLIRRFVAGNLRSLPDGRWTWRYDPAIGAAIRGIIAQDHWDAVAEIRCPALLLRGGASDTLTAEVAARMTRELASCSLVEFAGCGHPLWREAPAAFAGAIDEFLGADG